MQSISQAVLSKRIDPKLISRRVASNFGWSIISEAIGKGVFFITNIYLARSLGVEHFGIFALAQTITFYFWFAVDLGTTMYGIREIAKNKEHAKEIINPLFTLRITAGLVVFTLYMLSLFFLAMPAINKFCYAGCGLYLLTYSLYTDWIFKGVEKFKFIAFGSFASSVIFLTATLYFVKGSEAVVIASFAWSLSYLLAGLWLIYLLYYKMDIKLRLSFNFRVWRSHIKESVYFSISGILMLLYQYIPILLLSFFFTNYEVGIFSAPYRVVITICSAGFLIPLAFYPVFSELYAKDNKTFRKSHKRFQNVMLIIGTPVAIIGTVWGEQIVELLFGNQYEQSTLIFKMLIWLVPLYFLRSTYGSVLMAAGFQRQHNLATLTAVVCVCILGLFLVPQLNLKGGAIALILSELSMIGVLVFISKKTITAKRI